MSVTNRIEKWAHGQVREGTVGGATALITVLLAVVVGAILAAIYDPIARAIIGVIVIGGGVIALWCKGTAMLIRRAAANYEAKRKLLHAAEINDHYV